MPVYDYYCPNCYSSYKDIKIPLSEKSSFEKKCDKCGTLLVQQVAQLRFKLEGAGWYQNNDHPYAITQTELNNNLESEKRKEDTIHNMQANDTKIKEF